MKNNRRSIDPEGENMQHKLPTKPKKKKKKSGGKVLPQIEKKHTPKSYLGKQTACEKRGKVSKISKKRKRFLKGGDLILREKNA